jgi:hypothetical protein
MVVIVGLRVEQQPVQSISKQLRFTDAKVQSDTSKLLVTFTIQDPHPHSSL